MSATLLDTKGQPILDTWDEEGRIVARHARCPECKLGELEFTGQAQQSNTGPLFLHVCTRCKHQERIGKMQYPAMVFVAKEKDHV